MNAMLLDVIYERRAVKGDQFAADDRSQLSHESRSASTYSCASWSFQISLPRPRSSVISYLPSVSGLIKARTRRLRSSGGRRLAASINSSTLKIADISRLLEPKFITNPC